MDTKTQSQAVSGLRLEVNDEAGSLPELGEDAKITNASLVIHQHGYATFYLEIQRSIGPTEIRLQLSGKPVVEVR